MLRGKGEGLKAYQQNPQARIEKSNPHLHALDTAERRAQQLMAAANFGPGLAVKQARYARYYPEAELALVGLAGPIFRRADALDESSGMQSTGSLLQTLRILSAGKVTTIDLKRDADGWPTGTEEKADQPVRNVFFTIDGPGGEATQIDEAAKLIYQMGQNGILTTGFAEGLCCSAHYYLMAPMRVKVASRMSLTGSIGVVMGVPIPADKDTEGRNIIETPQGKRYVEFVNSNSEMKRADPTEKVGMGYYQNLVNESAAVFIGDVAHYLGISLDVAREQLGRGRVFGAAEARERRLVDDIGTFDEVFSELVGANAETGQTIAIGAA